MPFIETVATQRAGGLPARVRTLAFRGFQGTVAYSMLGTWAGHFAAPCFSHVGHARCNQRVGCVGICLYLPSVAFTPTAATRPACRPRQPLLRECGALP